MRYIPIIKILLLSLRLPIPFVKRRHYAAVIVKIDHIGDFILSISAIRQLMYHYGPEQCCLIISSQSFPIAEKEFPQTPLFSIPFLKKRNAFSMLKTLLIFKWKVRRIFARHLICFRHFRVGFDEAFFSLLKGERSFGIRPLAWPYNKNTLFTFSDLIHYNNAGTSDQRKDDTLLCNDLEMHQHLVSYTLRKNIPEKDVLPSFSTVEAGTDKTLLVAPFSSARIRDYPTTSMIEVIVKLRKYFHGKMLLTGSKDQARRLKIIKNRLNKQGISDCHVECELSLAAYIGLVARAKFVLSMESATAHIATALDKPMIALIGGGHYHQHGPWRKSEKQVWLTHFLPCFGCNWICIHPQPYCITRIRPTQLIEAFKCLT